MKILDIHMHGIGGFDTAAPSIDGILKIAELSGSLGVSEIILALYPSPIKVMREQLALVKEAMQGQLSKSDTACSKIRGVYLEGPFVNPLMCGALDANVFIEPTDFNFRELIEGYEDIIKIITVAPELHGALALIKKIAGIGMIASMGHSDATYSEAEAGFHAGARGITHIFNAMRGFHHREPGICGFGLFSKEIFIELIADPFHLDERTIELIFKIKRNDRIIIVSDSVKQTKIFPRNQAVKDESGRLRGGSMTVIESAKRLIGAGYDEERIMECITDNPERYLSGK